VHGVGQVAVMVFEDVRKGGRGCIWLFMKQPWPPGPLVVSLDIPIGIGPLRRGSVRVYRHYAVGVIDVSNIVLIVYVVKLRSLSNCELASLTLMVLCIWPSGQSVDLSIK
jgi:hypothetical protein